MRKETVAGFEEGLGVINLKLDIDYVFFPALIPLRFSSTKQCELEERKALCSHTHLQFSLNIPLRKEMMG